MDRKATGIIISLFLLYLITAEDVSAGRIPIIVNPRCQCINYTSNLINRRLMRDIDIIPTSSHCPHVEVIVTLKTERRICLDHTAFWVRNLIDRLLQKN
ncbi:interleukin-8-like [Chiloscyllium punctatum]|uniref:C-X-C motif chemokine n=1 Tax=Chiloscyllium punctatum TaxID=137246 RepID=A0A401RH40_CHIPU|nr:hypothetical protein [Chiloscyllium punctatum]